MRERRKSGKAKKSLRAMEKENCKRGEKKGIERVCKRKRESVEK